MCASGCLDLPQRVVADEQQRQAILRRVTSGATRDMSWAFSVECIVKVTFTHDGALIKSLENLHREYKSYTRDAGE